MRIRIERAAPLRRDRGFDLGNVAFRVATQHFRPRGQGRLPSLQIIEPVLRQGRCDSLQSFDPLRVPRRRDMRIAVFVHVESCCHVLLPE